MSKAEREYREATPFTRAFTEAFKRHMKEAGVTQQQLADTLGRNQGHISQGLNGKRFLTLSDVDALAELTGENGTDLMVELSNEAKSAGAQESDEEAKVELMGTKPAEVTELDRALAELLTAELAKQRRAQADLAREVDMPKIRISRYLKAVRPFYASDLAKIAQALNLDIGELVKDAQAEAANRKQAALVLDSDYGARHIADEIDEETLAAIRAARESGVGLAALEFDPREKREEDWDAA